MNSSAARLRLYYGGAGLLALIATLLRTCALFFSFDREIGYYNKGALPVILSAFAGLAILFFFSYLFTEKKSPEILPQPCSLPSIISAGAMALLMLCNFIVACSLQGIMKLPFLLWLLGILFLLLGTLYFILRFLAEKPPLTATLLLGYAVVFALALLLCFTYFDQQVGMNTPRKTDLHLSLLSLMFYMLYELKELAGMPAPRAARISGMLAFFLSLSVGVSNLLAFAAGIYSSIPYLVQDLLLVGFAAYIGTRGFAEARTATDSEVRE